MLLYFRKSSIETPNMCADSDYLNDEYNRPNSKADVSLL